MPQLALQSAEASTASRSNSITTPVEATSSSDQNLLNRARSPYEVPVDDSPTVGRIIRPSPSVPSLGPLSLSSPRSPRPAISSPLATSANFLYGQASPSPRTAAFPTRSTPTPTYRANQELENKSSLVKQTSFYSDSSDEGSPEPRSPRQGYAGSTNVLRTVSEPITSKPAPGSDSTKQPAMAGPVSAAQAEASKGVARNSSIDSAISAISTKSGTTGSQDGPHGPSEIAHLIKTAGSPETLIQYLLKEKHSQSQQNSQLWRLVDKQRAMILGLNKDLERALKDKEKYRKKLKEVISLSSASVSPQENTKEAVEAPVLSLPRVDIERAKEQTTPESPVLEAESPRNSPIDITIAPYPITPPADQPSAPHSAVGELLNPAHAMPKPQDHALDKYDHEAEERAAEEARKEKIEEPLKEIPYNVAIPPSRSLPSEPPKMPPPKPPVNHLPTVAVLEATPQPDEGLSKFPVPPPRKPPPAPLKLKQEMRTQLSPSPEDGETESDFDDILEVDEIVHDRRGRRRTREEDDRDREIIALKEAAARSASKKSKSSKSSQPGSPIQMPQAPAQELATASLGEMLSATKTREIPAPLLSPGLPASPRPSNFSSPPLSPRSMNFQAAPLSPRPPRQPIPLPPNTPLATPAPTPARATGKSIVSEETLVSQKSRTVQQETISHVDQPSIRMSSPSERTEVFKGLVTEEYPDLLLPPNALPSIRIAVASSRMKPSRASMMSLTQLEEDPVFTLAIISRSDNGELWRVEKDLASLTKLDQRLKQCTSYTVRAPERSLFSGHAPAKLDARRTVLEQFMDDILDIPFDTKTAVELCKYLSTHVLPPNLDDSVSIGDSSSEMNGNKIGPDGRPCRSGYLTKKGKNFGGWKARYFVLNGPLLKYFEVPGGAHLGTIKLQGAQIGKQNQNNDNQSPARVTNGDDLDNQFRHAFLILEPKKKDTSSHFRHVLCAESDKERDLWVDALLQWVDYRDPEDSEPPPSRGGPVQDRQTQGTATGTERPSAGKVRKPPGKPYHHPSDSDTLVGVRYDSTQAGDAPQVSGPARPKTSGGMPDQHHSHGFESFSSSQSKIISGPKDPQPISDLGAWGNKPNYGPTPDEKKQRKRSFFGFGPKTRSSSEGQDSLFGGSEVGANATPPQNSYQGPVRQAFGAPLAEAVRFCSPTDVNVPLPAVVYRCIQYLDSKNAVLEEGIFRLSGSNVVIKQLRERFNVEGDINLLTDRQYYDIHAVASLLKLYLRELPTTILTRDLHMEFLTTMEIADHAEKMTALGELVHRLPQANATLLKYLIGFLIKIINNADMNKMTVRNVGIVFSPTLNIPAPVFAMFLQNYEGIFGVDPEVYELPSPISEPELQRFEAPPRFDLPARPSTSGSLSPHGQMRKDNVRELQRSTPTPPLLVNNAPVRASPPSSATRPGYESPAGAYDIGYRPPSANEGRGAYDRRFLQASHEDLASASAAYDQSFVPSNRRRESAIFMGGMMGPHHQGSKSRLREETRF